MKEATGALFHTTPHYTVELTATDNFPCQKCKWTQKHILKIKHWKIHQKLINQMMWCNLQFEKAPRRDGWKLHSCAVTKSFADHYQQHDVGTHEF